MSRQLTFDNKQIIYQLSLTNTSLGLISPSLFVERLKERITSKLPNVNTFITYNPKEKGEPLVQVNCFSSKPLLDYQANNLQKEIAFIAANLRKELTIRMQEARISIV